MSIFKISDKKRFSFFFIIAGFSNSFINSIIAAIMSIIVPKYKRGKVFSLLSTITGGLSPIGMALGGILGEIFPYNLIMIVSFSIAFLAIIAMIATKTGKYFISTPIESKNNLYNLF